MFSLLAACLDDTHGAAYERTEPYLHTVKGALEAAIKRIAKSWGRAAGFASELPQAAGGQE
jgi:hypothetical protein